MRIELQSPYKELYKRGYLRQDKQGRRRVDLVNSEQDRTTVSYARYLVSVKEGRLLLPDEEVDHIDNDGSNDDIHNLQILSKEEHKAKTIKHRSPRKFVILTCPQCEGQFHRWENQTKGRTNIFCSRSCNASFTRAKNKWLGRKKN